MDCCLVGDLLDIDADSEHIGMPDPSRTRVCPAVNAIEIAAVASRTHAIVEPFRRVRSRGGMGAFVALTLASEEKGWCSALGV
eukprot:2113998-Pleurochrysis_carterae.AAC.1